MGQFHASCLDLSGTELGHVTVSIAAELDHRNAQYAMADLLSEGREASALVAPSRRAA